MMNCLIVEDEPIARNLLEGYISKAPGLQLAGSIDNGLEVIGFLKEQTVDLMFLDINMPEFTGIDLLKSLRNPPHVVITTAYSEYGAESYDYEVIDYLLKPISFERFLRAVQKVPGSKEKKGRGDIRLKVDGVIYQVPINSIRFVEAFGNYIKIHTDEEMHVIRKTLAQIEEELRDHLVRVHKSYLVAPGFIGRIEAGKITLKDGHQLPLGSTYKREVERCLGQDL